MRLSLLLLAPLLATPLLVASCSSKTDASGSDKLRTVQGFCASWAEKACNDDVVERCSAASADACRATQADFCETLIPTGKYSELTAKDCLAAVKAAYKDTELLPAERDVVRKLGGACDRIISGTGAEGDTCSEPGDCNRDDELTCLKKGGAAEGTCQLPEEVTGGEDCSSAHVTCVEGFYCDGANCIRGKPAGSACTASVPCGVDLQCLTAEGTPPGEASPDGGVSEATCVAKEDVGADCTTDADCKTGICAPRLAPAKGLCTAKVVLAPTEPTCTDLQ